MHKGFKMDKTISLQKVLILKDLFEKDLIPKLQHHEVNPGLPKGDRLNYLYFTLPVSINFQRSSPALWAAALKTFEDPETSYLFYPEKVVLAPREKIQNDLIKYKLALQKNKHVDIWIKLCKTLHQYYSSDPRTIVEENNNDVERIINTLRFIKKKDFPYLSGAKMSNYWLFILQTFTDVQLKNLHSISIIPDTHVMQASIVLGITKEKDTPETVARKWFELLDGSGMTPIEMHPILWNWSRAKFRPLV